jgi:hypothetical protein
MNMMEMELQLFVWVRRKTLSIQSLSTLGHQNSKVNKKASRRKEKEGKKKDTTTAYFRIVVKGILISQFDTTIKTKLQVHTAHSTQQLDHHNHKKSKSLSSIINEQQKQHHDVDIDIIDIIEKGSDWGGKEEQESHATFDWRWLRGTRRIVRLSSLGYHVRASFFYRSLCLSPSLLT